MARVKEWRDRGAGMVEYGAVMVLLGTLVGALVALGLPAAVASLVNEATCRISGAACGAASGPATGAVPQRRPPAPRPATPQRPQEDPGVKAVTDVLKETARGRAILAELVGLGVRFARSADDVTYFDDRTNTLYLGRGKSPDENALSVAHEAEHARTRNRPDPRAMKREDYIEASGNEEAEGLLLGFRARNELAEARARARQPQPPYRPGQREVEREADRRVEQHKAELRAARRRPLTADAERRLREDKVREVLREAVRNGGYQQPLGNGRTRPFSDAYGEDWDRANGRRR